MLILNALERNKGNYAIAILERFSLFGLTLFALAALIPLQHYGIDKIGSVSETQCIGNLQNRNIGFSINEGAIQPNGCSTQNTIILENYGIRANNLGPMQCGLATKFINWSNGKVNLAAMKIFRSGLARIETFGTYNCRQISGTSNLSEHAFSNAIDVSAFILENDRRISVIEGWSGGSDEQRFLRMVRDDACQQFGTVLSPDYNAAHKDHFHLDDAQRKFGSLCR